MILTSDADRAQFHADVRKLTDPTGGLADPVAALLATLSSPRFPGAIVPVVERDRMRFYALANDARQWRLLQPLLMASVGLTFTSFDGRTLSALSDEGVESIFARHRLVVAAFEGPSGRPNWNEAALRALTDLIRQVEEAPEVARERPFSAAELLHQFDLALGAGNEAAAEVLLGQLESRHLLDTMNLRFLRVHLHATFGEWQLLRSRPWFANLAQTRRTPEVTAALVEALYHAELSDESDWPAEDALEFFRRRVVPYSGSLFEHAPPTRSPAVATAFLWYAVAEQRPELRSMLEADVSADWPEREYRRFNALLGLMSGAAVASPRADPLAVVHSLLDDPQADVGAVIAALASAAGLETLEAERLRTEIQQRFPAVQTARELAIAGADTSPRAVPRNWTEWFQLLPNLPYEEARQVADRAAAEWPIADHLPSYAAVEELARALDGALSGPDAARAIAGVPHLIRWVQGDPAWPNPDYQPLYLALFLALLLADTHHPDALRWALQLAAGLLELGVSEDDYRLLADGVREALRPLASFRTLELILDAVELFTLFPCSSEDARDAVWAEALGVLGKFASRFQAHHRAIVEDLCRMLGTADGFSLSAVSTTEAPPDSAWSGRIAIYTLREKVGHRVRAVLGTIYPQATIDVRSDHVASPALREWASAADVLLVDWSAAKHAATLAIREARGIPPRWVTGGASSLVGAAIEEVVGLRSYEEP